jgi:hypothetical protein
MVEGSGFRVRGAGCRVEGSGPVLVADRVLLLFVVRLRVYRFWLEGLAFCGFSGFSIFCGFSVFSRAKRFLLVHPGGNPGANLKSIFHRCYLFEEAFVWKLSKENPICPWVAPRAVSLKEFID